MTYPRYYVAMKIIFDLEPVQNEKIRRLISDHLFSDFDQFLQVAIENQIRAEEGLGTWSGDRPTSEVGVPRGQTSDEIESLHLLLAKPRTQVRLAALEKKRVVSQLLWGQYYRFLPSKIGLLTLANLCTNAAVPLDEFRRAATQLAVRFRLQLAEYDRRLGAGVGERLATSFPTAEKSSGKRYADQFLVYRRTGDMKFEGMLARLLFVGVDEEGRDVSIAPSDSGLEFAKLSNPVVDGDPDKGPLSPQEQIFLIEHIKKSLPFEYEHMSLIAQVLDAKDATVDDVGREVMRWYKKREPTAKWTDGMVTTMAAGALSRMAELGLVCRTEPKRGSPYQLTREGRERVDLQ